VRIQLGGQVVYTREAQHRVPILRYHEARYEMRGPVTTEWQPTITERAAGERVMNTAKIALDRRGDSAPVYSEDHQNEYRCA
jgi:hypothetical protein